MKKYRFAVRTILYPESPWLKIPPTQMREEIRKTLVFNSAGTANETIEKWRQQQYEVITTIRKQIDQKLNPIKIGIPNIQEIQISSHKFKEMFRYVEELSENNLIIPFHSIQAKAIQKNEQIGTIDHLIQVYPAGPVITKSLIYTEKSNINKELKKHLFTLHKSFLGETEKIITKIILKNDLNATKNKEIEKIRLKPRTTANFSYLTLNRIREKNALNVITKIYKDEELKGVNSFIIETNQSTPKKVINKAETLIDWYFAFKGSLEWVGKKIDSYENWNIHEWVYYYSLLSRVFNPENYYDPENAFINPIRMVRTRYLRDLWKILVTDSPASINKWINNINTFLEVISNNSLLFAKFFDDSYVQLLLKNLKKPIPKQPLNNIKSQFKYVFPKLNCKEATILTIFLELGKIFFTNKNISNLGNLLASHLSKGKLDWPKILISTINNESFNPELVDDKGWVTTNFIRGLLVEDKTIKRNFSYQLFQKIPEKDCNEPILEKWRSDDFSTVPGESINYLIKSKLVEAKKRGKFLRLRPNIKSPFIQYLILA